MVQVANLDNKPEIFYTLQGEGISLGKPAIFVRLARCNLACIWCDTPYTWNWTGTKFIHKDNVKYDKSKEIIDISEQEIVSYIKKFDCKRVVITGGEPMLQQKAIAKIARLLGEDYFIEIETNGTHQPDDDLIKLISQFNISPKLASSGNLNSVRHDILSGYASLSKATFKFVISSVADFVEVADIITKCKIKPSQVYLMPEGRTVTEINNNSQTLANICKAKGYNYTTRLHILLWGAKKGV